MPPAKKTAVCIGKEPEQESAMYQKNYRIADCVIAICSLYQTVHAYCAGYETDEPAEFSVVIAPEDIVYEREKCAQEYRLEQLPPPHFSEEVLETTAVYRKIAEQLIDRDRLVFHGSVVAADGQAYLFTAKSGTGKSTHTRLWRELLGERAVMVNDDKPILHVGADHITAYGTPYNGKHRLGSNIAVPLKAVCILERADQNRITRIGKSEAYAMLLQQSYRPQKPAQLAKALHLIDELAEKTALYRLHCNMDLSAAELSYQTMKGTAL